MEEGAPLKRRTGLILTWLLLACLLAGLFGTVLVFWADPAAGLRIVLVAAMLGFATARAFEPGLLLTAIMTVLYTLLGGGLYALYLFCAVPFEVLFSVAAALAALIGVLLLRALIAAGSADYPYDE